MKLTAFAERGWRPAYNGFYFQDIYASSAAAVAAMAAHGLGQQTLTMPEGLSSLTDALAASLDLRTGVKVTHIDESATSATVHTGTGTLRADNVIVAVPGPHISGITDPNRFEAAVARTSYSAGLLVALGTNRHLHPDELSGAYGVLAHPDEGPLAAMCVASRAGHAHAPGTSSPACSRTGPHVSWLPCQTPRSSASHGAPYSHGLPGWKTHSSRTLSGISSYACPMPCPGAPQAGSHTSRRIVSMPRAGGSSSREIPWPGRGRIQQRLQASGQPTSSSNAERHQHEVN